AALSLVAGKGAVPDGQGAGVVHAPAQAVDRAGAAPGGARGDRRPPAALAQGLVAAQHAVRQSQVPVVEDPAARPVGQAVGDGRAGDVHGGGEDVNPRASVFATDGQQPGARAVDGQVLADDQLAAGQRDGLASEAGVEDDRVPAGGVGGGDFTAQR